MYPFTVYIAFFELITVPIIAYLIYKKQLEKYGKNLVRKSGKKCLSPSDFLLVSLGIFGVVLALIMYQVNEGFAYM